jgi:hypothetical protein
MQTASQIPEYTPAPYQTVVKKSSNGQIKASFIIGLIIFGFGLINSLTNTISADMLVNRAGWSYAAFGIFVIGYQLILFIVPGVIGLILGISGFKKMVKNPPPYDYFMAIGGIALCFGPAIGLINFIFSIVSSTIIAPLLF